MATLFDPSVPLNHTIIASYDDFLQQGVPHAVSQLEPIQMGEHLFSLGGCTVHRPGHLEDGSEFHEIDPGEAYLRDLDFRVMVRVDVLDHGRVFLHSQLLCFLPLMIGSQFDPSLRDEGGYFIIQGTFKFIINAENQRPNSPHFIVHDGSWRCDIVSGKTRLVINDDLTIKHMGLKKTKLVHLLAALGASESLSELFIRPGDELRLARFVSMLSPQFGSPDILRGDLSNRVLPHLGTTPADDEQKLFWLLRWTRQLLECKHGMRPATDRDHLSEKRISTAGAILEEKFAAVLSFFWRTCRQEMTVKEGTDIELAINSNARAITGAIHDMMKTGVVSKSRTGFVRSADRAKTELAFTSNPRKTNHFLARTGRQYLPRGVHGSHFGFICPAETPSGESIGYTKTPAQTCEYTVTGNAQFWVEHIRALSDPWRPGDDRVMLNGRILGRPAGPDVYSRLRALRVNDPHASVTREEGAIMVDISAGRWVRPVWTTKARNALPWLASTTLENAIPHLLPFSNLILLGLIEYVDPGDDCIIALDFASFDASFTHCELDASLILGESASRIPLVHHTPAPRIAFQSDMAQQAIGMVADANPIADIRCVATWESSFNALWYGERMLNPTWSSRRRPMLPSITNMVVMFLTRPSNQEDSTVMSLSSTQLGLARASKFKVFTEMCGRGMVFGVGGADNPRLKKVSASGLPEPGSFLIDGDALACRFDPKTRQVYPTYYHGRERACVEDVLITTNMDNHVVAKIKLRFTREVFVGDKFSTMHGQKGTVGRLESRENLPFSSSGMSPDIIMNPHAIPSRMTIGQTIEMQLGKAAALRPWAGRDATAFWGLHDYELELQREGFVRTGEETVYCGETGEMMRVPIFIGIAAYQRLKHVVVEKVHARPTRGLISLLTRQPLAGRSRGGGFRLGQMEADAILAHGAAMLLHERFFTSSDGVEVYFCSSCGSLGWKSASLELVCSNHDCLLPQFIKKYTSHTFLVLFHELLAMGVRFAVTE